MSYAPNEPTWYAAAGSRADALRIVEGIRDVRLWREALDREALARANAVLAALAALETEHARLRC